MNEGMHTEMDTETALTQGQKISQAEMLRQKVGDGDFLKFLFMEADRKFFLSEFNAFLDTVGGEEYDNFILRANKNKPLPLFLLRHYECHLSETWAEVFKELNTQELLLIFTAFSILRVEKKYREVLRKFPALEYSKDIAIYKGRRMEYQFLSEITEVLNFRRNSEMAFYWSPEKTSLPTLFHTYPNLPYKEETFKLKSVVFMALYYDRETALILGRKVFGFLEGEFFYDESITI